jgi:hypothetical protein
MFPMDSQTCKLGLESYGYDVDDIGMLNYFLIIINYMNLKSTNLNVPQYSDYYWGERRSDGKKPEDAVSQSKSSTHKINVLHHLRLLLMTFFCHNSEGQATELRALMFERLLVG